MGLVGPAREPTPSSPAATWTRSPTAGPTTDRWASSSALAAVEELKVKGFSPERAAGYRGLHRGRRRAVWRSLPGQPPDDRGHRPGGRPRPHRRRRRHAGRGDDGRGLRRRPARPREDLLDSIGAFVELHVEQGRALAPLGAAVGLAEGIWPHGRWRLDFTGPRRPRRHGPARRPQRPDAALREHRPRRPPAPPRCHGALATFGKVIAEPGGANGVPSAVTAWLDARAPDEATLAEDCHHGPFGLREMLRGARGGAQRPAGVVHPGGPFRPGAAGPDRRRARRGRGHGAGAADRGRARRRGARGAGADGHAVRAQPHRRLAFARRARRPGRLRSRRARARPGPGGPGRAASRR